MPLGTDGHVPIEEQTTRRRLLNYGDLYLGAAGLNKYVSNVDDLIWDADTGQLLYYLCTEVDPVTKIPTLVALSDAEGTPGPTPGDALLGPGPVAPTYTFLAYLDTSVTPFRLTVDRRLVIPGTDSLYAKLFLGPDLTATGTVVSALYDASGNLLTQDIPLVPVEAGASEIALSIIPECRTTSDLPNGELLTVMVYSQSGALVAKRQVMVERTTGLANRNDSRAYIARIALKSPFLAPQQDRLLQLPVNLPWSALNPLGEVTYSNGVTQTHPVDGVRFTLLGLEQFLLPKVGATLPLVLRYTIAPGDIALDGLSVDRRAKSEPYTLEIVAADSTYAVRLFGFPHWVSLAAGYTLRWFLLNLDRNRFFEVTGAVSLLPATGAFDPKAYGVLQRRVATLNLADVAPSYPSFQITQTFNFVIYLPQAGGNTPWTVNQPPGVLLLGEGLYARSSNGLTQIDSGCLTQAEWLERIYRNSAPLYDPTRESAAPAPTHVLVTAGETSVEIPITGWNQAVNLGATLPLGSDVLLKFIHRAASNDLIVGVSVLMVL